MNRLIRGFEGWPGTVALLVGIVVGFVIRGGLVAGWPKPFLLLLALGIGVPVLLWVASYALADRRRRNRNEHP